MSLRIKKGDTVQIIAGDSKGQTGKVLRVNPGKGRLLIENRNVVKRHTKPNKRNQQGGILEKEASISLSNCMLLDSKANKPARVGIRILEDGKKVRFSKKTQEQID
ncbi:MAG: 50S ribosomal protein L24 [Chitinivibrionales bacterium]|nr:50S ribosomal protein L24 [Chitinivibrionales bacterium]